jgi:hypothetical protein
VLADPFSGIAGVFFQKVVEQARAKDLLSDEHFTVDGTLIEAWAGQNSFQRKDAPPPPEIAFIAEHWLASTRQVLTLS